MSEVFATLSTSLNQRAPADIPLERKSPDLYGAGIFRRSAVFDYSWTTRDASASWRLQATLGGNLRAVRFSALWCALLPTLEWRGRRGACDIPEHARPGPAGAGRCEHGLRAASTGEARGGVGLSATGVTKVPERSERQLAGDGSPAACAIRPDRRHKARREHTTENDGQSVASRRVLRCLRVGATAPRTGGRPVAAGSRGNRVSLLLAVRPGPQPRSDPIRSDPEFQSFMAELQKSSLSLRRTLFPDGK